MAAGADSAVQPDCSGGISGNTDTYELEGLAADIIGLEAFSRAWRRLDRPERAEAMPLTRRRLDHTRRMGCG